MQRLSRPRSVCGLSSTSQSSKQLWSRSLSHSLPGSVRLRVRIWPRRVLQVPMRNAFPLYELPDLILDLDAEGSKHVRDDDPSIDGDRVPHRTVHHFEQLALLKRVSVFERQYEQESRRHAQINSQTYLPWEVSDLDILAYALLGPSSNECAQPQNEETRDAADSIPIPTPTSQFEEVMETVHDQNSIPRHAQADLTIGIPYLMRRQKTRQKSATGETEELFQNQIGRCRDLTELRRLVQIQLSRPGGCKFIRSQSSKIARRCRALEHSASRYELKELLAFINDVTIKLASQGLPISDELAGLGLRLSACCGAFPAMQMYFATTDHWRTVHMAAHVDKALLEALSFLTWQTGHTKHPAMSQEVRVSRVAAYTTFTGYAIHGEAFEMSYQSALRQQKNDPLRHAEHFLHILAELGAFRTIWHTLRKSVLGKAPFIPHDKSDWFVSAISRALNNVNSGRIRFAKETLQHASSDYEADCKLDLQTIMSSSIHHHKPGKGAYRESENQNQDDKLPNPYDNLDPGEASQKDRSHILAALRQGNAKEFLSILVNNMHGPKPS
ncbi:hypothetical protein PG999_007135 [Apiospora kogelbergensis]|uniref:Uncharacterized protein n=1 Tax=Apiospora kogelbergensis TaxID=1337665 RepID=A0AAW0QXF8_9PEZI